MTIKKYIGLEIEMVYNSQKINLKVGQYHEGIKNGKFWKCEHDNSIKPYLNTENWKDWGKSVEFVSILLDSEKKVKLALKEFYDIMSKKGLYQLNETINFNNSSGLHIHFSVKKEKREYKNSDYVEINVLKQMRKRTLKDIKSNAFIFSNRDILKHYNRSYARKINFKNETFFRENSDKYKEFNFYSEENNQGLEWRSPNLLNVKTWNEFNILMDIYLKNVNFTQKKLIKSKSRDNIILEIDETEQFKPLEEHYILSDNEVKY